MRQVAPKLTRLALSFLACSGLVAAQGCTKSTVACATSAACGNGTVCTAGRCLDAEAIPVPQRAQRVVLDPLSVAVLSSRHGNTTPAYVSFGKETWGDVVLLLRFPAPFSNTTQIHAAHLVMMPTPGSIPGPSPVRIQVARVLEPWAAHEANWATLPQLSSTNNDIWVSSWAGRPLRIDVTKQVRRWTEQRHDDHGLAVMASPQTEFGETYSLGTGEGRGPRLDVYLQ